MERTKVIAITGGPCGGKTAFLDYAQTKLRAKGIRPFFAPESATIFIGGGVQDLSKIKNSDPKTYIEIERQMLLFQLDLKNRFEALASCFKNEKRVLLCDRGAKDVNAYVPKEIFEALLQEEGLNIWDVRDCYDAVIYLCSAASGTEKFYTTANNPSRQEKDPEKARCVDELTLKAWIGHQHLWIIPSRENFEEKLAHALRAVSHTLRSPSVEIERKFLLKKKPDLRKIFGTSTKLRVEQLYLLSDEKPAPRIRKVTEGGYSAYYWTRKKKFPCSKISYEDPDERISALDYIYLSQNRDLAANPIRKDRYYFVWQNQYFSLDVIREPKKLYLLEIELLGENDPVALPPFLEIDHEVTEDPRYSNSAIARGEI